MFKRSVGEANGLRRPRLRADDSVWKDRFHAPTGVAYAMLSCPWMLRLSRGLFHVPVTDTRKRQISEPLQEGVSQGFGRPQREVCDLDVINMCAEIWRRDLLQPF